MSKLNILLSLLGEFEETPNELPEPDSGSDILYYKNNKTGAIFISVDGGENLVNPVGKTIEFDDELYTETEPDESKLSDKQKIVIKDSEFQATKKVSGDVISWNGLSITKANRDRIQDGKAVAVSAFGSSYFLIDTSDLDPNAEDFKSIAKDRAEKELSLRLRVRGQGRTSYRLTSPYIK